MQDNALTFDSRRINVITAILSVIVLMAGVYYCGKGADTYRYKSDSSRIKPVMEQGSFLPAVEIYKRMKDGMDQQTGQTYLINTTGDGVLGFFTEKSRSYDYMIACIDDHDQFIESTIRIAPHSIAFFDNSGKGLKGDGPIYFMRMFFDDISLEELRVALDKQANGWDEASGEEVTVTIKDRCFHIAKSDYPVQPEAQYVLYLSQ